MAYKQSPGRMAMPKTGRGISPTLMCGSPMKQQKKKDPHSGKTRQQLNDEINNFGIENQRRVAAEAVAKSDSSAVASRAMKLDKTLSKKMAARKGNEAANKTRSKEKIPQVQRGSYANRGTGPNVGVKDTRDVYIREGQLDRDFPTSLVNAWAKSK
jgi:hypothetical protein